MMHRPTKKAAAFVTALAALAAVLVNRCVSLALHTAGNIAEKLNAAANVLEALLKRPLFFDTSRPALLAALGAAALVWLAFLYHSASAKNYMPGAEHGTARWGTNADIRPLMNPEPDMNIPLSATEQISFGTVKDFRADRNKNILVLGGTGSGKTYSEIKPSLMQLHSSYVITDPKGTLLPETGHMFHEHGYEVRAFNTIDFSKSLHYNPLAYIRREADILKVVNVLIENTKGKGAGGDKFWEDCERMLYTAFIAYLWYETLPEDLNIPTMIEMLSLCQVREDDPDFQSPADVLFEELEAKQPTCLAVMQYKQFKQAAGKTMQSILISCGARLAPFNIDELREITRYDELELRELGMRKTAFFIIMSDTDKTTYAFLIAMIMYQMFNVLCETADNECGGTLPVPVRCLLDEFANIGKIPDFEHLISTIRSRGISCMLILQSMTQLYSAYKDDAGTIMDCCDTVVFLGGKSTKTTKELSEMLGKTTIDTRSTSESKGQSGSFSLQNGISGRDLLDPSEIGRLDRGECLVLITGLPPFRSKKYPTHKHRRFKEIHDGGAPLYDIRAAIQETVGRPDALPMRIVDVELDSSLFELNELLKNEKEESGTDC